MPLNTSRAKVSHFKAFLSNGLPSAEATKQVSKADKQGNYNVVQTRFWAEEVNDA
jgi:hypothetical protein